MTKQNYTFNLGGSSTLTLRNLFAQVTVRKGTVAMAKVEVEGDEKLIKEIKVSQPNPSEVLIEGPDAGSGGITVINSGRRSSVSVRGNGVVIGGNILMNIPVWFTNEFYDRKLELKNILSDSGIKSASITEEKYGKEKLDIKVSFGNHHAKASEVAILICKEIFGMKEPCVFDYKTHNLARK